jgi:hypothetical protein
MRLEPTIGRIVHYVREIGSAPVPALITAVHSDACVNLHVFNDSNDDAIGWLASVVRDDLADPTTHHPQPRTWHWPEVKPFIAPPPEGNPPSGPSGPNDKSADKRIAGVW